MKLLNGKKLALQLEQELKETVDRLKAENIHPKLAVILVGENRASKIYVQRKREACKRLGIDSITKKLPTSATKKEILNSIATFNEEKSVHGILCQSPLPNGVNEREIFEAIHFKKDVDCFHPYNMGLLTLGSPQFMPCTPFGIIQLLQKNKINLQGKNVVVLGRSNIVGRPLSILLSYKKYNATVTLCHSGTKDLKSHLKEADILIVAIGKAEFVTAEFIKDGAVVVDAGINRIHKEGKNILVGDVHFASCLEKAAAITPVPGGVGPMTISMLLYNCINAAALQNNKERLLLE